MSPWSQTGGMSSVQRLECKPRSGPSFGVMRPAGITVFSDNRTRYHTVAGGLPAVATI